MRPVPVTTHDCRRLVDDLFHPRTHDDDFRIGFELELFTHRPDGGRPALAVLQRVVESIALPGGGRLSLEPGGAVELSTAPFPAVDLACEEAFRELAVVVEALAAAGVATSLGAIDTARPPRRIVTHPRYRFMEKSLDAYSPAGRWMMNNTASVQVNLSNCRQDPLNQWKALWRARPVLTAMFANSPGLDRQGRRWASLRQGCWLALDPDRTGPIDPADGAAGYAEFALNAPVLVIGDGRGGGSASWSATPTGVSFADWIASPGKIGREPVEADFVYHLSTLFPDIRPRRWMEVRCIDMVPLEHLEAVATVVTAISDPSVAGRVMACVPDVSPMRAAMYGLSDPEIAAAAVRLAGLAVDRSGSIPGGRPESLARFVEHYTARGRMPGDDLRPVSGHLAPDLGPHLDSI